MELLRFAFARATYEWERQWRPKGVTVEEIRCSVRSAYYVLTIHGRAMSLASAILFESKMPGYIVRYMVIITCWPKQGIGLGEAKTNQPSEIEGWCTTAHKNG